MRHGDQYRNHSEKSGTREHTSGRRSRYRTGSTGPALSILHSVVGDSVSRIQISGLRWVIIALLFVATLLAYLDLQELSVLAPILRQKLNIGDSQYAFITQAFLLSYSIMFCLGG